MMPDEASDAPRLHPAPGDGQVGHWRLDPSHSTVTIAHKAMWGMTTVRGSFTEVGGEGEVLADGSAAGTLVINAASVDTANDKRDTHLKSADFLDAENHRDITFVARRIHRQGNGSVRVTGDLTVAGQTRPLSFDAGLAGLPDGSLTLTAEVRVDRAEFGLVWNNLGMLRGQALVRVNASFVPEHDLK
jgi:polyisoprenoid-binding protein YceI